MQLNKEGYRALTGRLKVYMILNVLGILSVYFLVSSEAIWVERRSEAVIIPDFKYTYPMFHYMPVSNKEMSEAKLYTFVEQYLKRVYNERMINYHRPTSLGRSDTAYLKTSLLEAIEMSRGTAKKENLEKFVDSQETYVRLKQCNCGWLLNIYAIESIKKTNHNDAIYVSVLGEFQLTYDEVQADLPHKLWGFKRIWLTIVQGRPSRNADGTYKNEYGLYVTDQQMENLDYYRRDNLMKQIYDKGYFIP